MKKIFITIILTLSTLGCGEIPPDLPSPYDRQGSVESVELNNTIYFRFIDVGQGDATLITTPNGKSILIDAGTSEMGVLRVSPLIEELNVNLELIIASHYDSDHTGGIPEIIKGPDGMIDTADDIIPRAGVLDRGEPDAIDTTIISNYFIITSGIRYSLEAGDSFTIDGVTFSILGQNGVFSDGRSETLDAEFENAHSISLLISYKEITYLTSGDLPGPNFPNKYEPYDLEKYVADLAGEVDILHVSHHGSHNSTNADFISTVRPGLAIISVGENDFGHPYPVVIENLLSAGAEIYLTEGDWINPTEGVHVMNGDICMETDGVSLIVDNCN